MSPWPWAAPLAHLLMLATALAVTRWRPLPHALPPLQAILSSLWHRAPLRGRAAWRMGLIIGTPVLAVVLGIAMLTVPVLGWLLGVLSLGLCLHLQPDETADIPAVASQLVERAVAPLCWLAIAGVPGLLLGTGTCALARGLPTASRRAWPDRLIAFLSDGLLYVPARLSARLLVWACQDTRGRRRGLRIARRDGRAADRPSEGWPVAAMAGLLGVRLVLPGQPALGEDRRPCDTEATRLAGLYAERAAYAAVLVPILTWLTGTVLHSVR